MIVCVPPWIDTLLTVKHGELACGQKVAVHFDPCGEIAEFDGMLTEYEPVAVNDPLIVVLRVPPVHVYCVGPYCGLGEKTNE